MTDKPASKDLESILARLEHEWQELAGHLKTQEPPRDGILEVERLRFRDAAGKYRGKISVNEDGSAGLILSDHEGSAWAWLGINQDGEAFLELKDKNGEISFKVPIMTPVPEAAAEPAPPPAPEPPPPLPEAEVGPQAITFAEETLPPPVATGPLSMSPASHQDPGPGGDFAVEMRQRLEALEGQRRRQGWFKALLVGLLALVLASQAFLWLQPPVSQPLLEVERLVIRAQNGTVLARLGEQDGQAQLNLWDQQGQKRATLGLGSTGSPALTLFDPDQRVRVQLRLGPDSAPRLIWLHPGDLLGKTQENAPSDTANQQSGAAVTAEAEEGTACSALAGPEAAATMDREEHAEAALVASRTSNKYHDPTCKWVKWIKPAHLITFKSPEEAREQRYRPCPACKPPPAR